MNITQKHIPVMLNEVLENLNPTSKGVYVDATFGFGGYTTAILEKAPCKVIAIDRDPSVRTRAEEIEKKYKDRFEFRLGKFSNLKEFVSTPVDGIVFDIGVSSMQLDDADRGFSFSKEAKLDMRMSSSGASAYDMINTLSQEELADILYKFGEEKKSRQIAQKIVERRQKKPIETTTELAEIIYQVVHKKAGQTDPATRSFQAIRIAVNDELSELEQGLKAASELLKPEGRLVVVDFHSLEDRIVKNFFKSNSAPKVHISKYAKPVQKTNKIFSFVSDAIAPQRKEIDSNPRARSAKLRFGIKNKGEKDV